MTEHHTYAAWNAYHPEDATRLGLILTIDLRSYASTAMLRRNIVAFIWGQFPYVPVTFKRRLQQQPEHQKEPAMFASIVRLIRHWKRYNQSLTELSRLGDRELADIGISRSDIHRVAWNASYPR